MKNKDRYWLVEEDEDSYIIGLIYDDSGCNQHHTNYYTLGGKFIASIEHVYDYDSYIQYANSQGWAHID